MYSINPILTGRFLQALDEMGHGDALVVADAHFPAARLARRQRVDLPGLPAPRVLAAIRTVVVPDKHKGFQLGLMAPPGDDILPVQRELIEAIRPIGATVSAEVPTEYPGHPHVSLLSRQDFYDRAAQAELIIQTGETRMYGNALFFKGVTPPFGEDR